MTDTQAVFEAGTKAKDTKRDKEYIDRLTFPKLPATKMVSSYFDYKNRKKTPLPPLQWDTAPQTYRFYFYTAKHTLETITQEANRMRRTIPLSSEHFKKYWEQQQEKADKFRNLFEISNEFVARNEEKRRRFLLKLEQSKETLSRRNEELDTIMEKITFMKEVKRKMEEKIKDYEIYTNFLNAVIKLDLQLRNTHGVVQRYEALLIARRQIAETQERNENILKEAREKLKRLVEEYLAKHNELYALLDSFTRRYAKAKSLARRADYLIAVIYEEAHLRKWEILVTKQSCWQIYQHMKRKEFSTIDLSEEDFVGQLTEINRVLGTFQKLLKKLGKRK